MYHSQEIINASEKLKLNIQELSSLESQSTMLGILNRFCNKGIYKYPIWENLIDSIAIDCKFSWSWFKEILIEQELILFFEPDDDKKMFYFDNGKQIVEVLLNCYRFNFYITNLEQTFLFAYNDHDYLIACGNAKEWLRSYILEYFPNTIVHGGSSEIK